ncbi:MAG: DNA polymerase, partial [bacterium]
FLDLNSYFASIEQELQPALLGKPIGVVPVMAETTCCIATSYEAKAVGVKTGTLVSDARRLCPKIQFVEARHQVYVEFHHQIVKAVESCLPVSAVMSVDEMACRLIGRERTEERVIEIAMEMKQALRDQVGKTLRCSVGLAPNRFLAKVATEMQKPDGLVVIRSSDLPDKLYSLQLQDIPGIGGRMYRRVLIHGVKSVEQLCALPKREMRRIWGGVVGERFWHWLRGDDFEEEPTKRRTIGHSHVLAPEFKTMEGAFAVTQKLVHKAGMRLRKMGYWAGAMSVKVRFGRELGWDKKIEIVECQDTLTLLEALHKMWEDIPRKAGNPTSVGITVYNLVPDNVHNLSLFEENKRAQLADAIDAINTKFGTNTIYFGGIHKAKTAAPTRIAFTSIPDWF